MRLRHLPLPLLLAAAGLVPSVLPAARGGEQPGPTSREMQALRTRLEFATSGRFYLVLEPQAGRLRLLHGAAILEDYPFETLEIGAPRRVYGRPQTPPGWAGRAWPGGRLDPPRRLAVTPPEGIDLEEWVPPTPEEAYPVPARFAVRFEGLSLEVETGAQPGGIVSGVADIARRLLEATRLLLGAPPDALRVRLRLSSETAASLFRGLPEGLPLLILPPG